MALSGAAIALSLAFIEKIVPNPVGFTVFILVSGWLLLRWQIKSLDKEYGAYFAAKDIEQEVEEPADETKPEIYA